MPKPNSKRRRQNWQPLEQVFVDYNQRKITTSEAILRIEEIYANWTPPKTPPDPI